jgi:hypothetical protein
LDYVSLVRRPAWVGAVVTEDCHVATVGGVAVVDVGRSDAEFVVADGDVLGFPATVGVVWLAADSAGYAGFERDVRVDRGTVAIACVCG